VKKSVLIPLVVAMTIVVSCATGGVLIIKDGITEIPDEKYKSKKLTSVTIPDSVTKIGKKAFFLNNLTSITIPDGVTEIGDTAFYGNKLTSLTIPDSVTKIEGSVFARNELTSIIIPSSVTEIHGGAFAGNKITNLIIPDSVTGIGRSAFADNPLKSVTLTLNEITSIEENAFGSNIQFNRFFLANSKQSGIYSWQDNNYYYNGEILPYSAVVAYEQGELQKARELTELARAREREKMEKIRRENAFLQISWVKSAFTNNLLSGTVVSSIDGKPIANYFFSHAGSQMLRAVGIMDDWYCLSPGLHTLGVSYRDVEYTINQKITTTGDGGILFNFEAGKAYTLVATEAGDKIKITFEETRGP
jgi:hypothetical protein